MPFVPDAQPTGGFTPDPQGSGPRTRAIAPSSPAGGGEDPTKTMPGWVAPPQAKYVYDWGKGVYDSIADPQTDPHAPTGNPLTAPLDAAAALATGIVSPVLGAVKKYGGALIGADTGDRSLQQNISDFQYEPRTQAGQAVVGAAGATLKPALDVFDKSGEGYAGIADVLGASPETQADVHTMFGQVVPTVLGGPEALRSVRRASPVLREGLDAAREGVRSNMAAAGMEMAPEGFTGNPRPYGDPTATARKYGFILTPDSVATEAQRTAPPGSMGAPVPGRFRGAVAGPEHDYATMVENSKRADALMQEIAGLPPGTPTSAQTLAMERGQWSQQFDRLAAEVPTVAVDNELGALVNGLGAERRWNPLLEPSMAVEKLRARLMEAGQVLSTQDVLDAIREWRYKASVLYKTLDDPAKLDQAAAYREMATAFESALERSAERAGRPDLVQAMQQARTQMARLHDIEGALVPGTTSTDLRRLAKIGESSPLSGPLADLAEVGRYFPDIARSAVGVPRPTPSATGMLASVGYGLRRLGGEQLIPGLTGEKFQNQFGLQDPMLKLRPDAPPRPFGSPDVGPQWPPPGGRFERPLAGEGPLELAPEGGDVPFTSTQVPPGGDVPTALGDEFNPFAGAQLPDSFPFDLESPLAASAPESALPGYGHPEMPTAPYQINPDQLRPDVPLGQALHPYPDDMAVVPPGPRDIPPEPPAAAPDVLPAPSPFRPRAGGPNTSAATLNFAPEGAQGLPGSIADLLAEGTPVSGAPSPYGVLPPELQALADVLTGVEPRAPGGPVVPYNPLDQLAAELGANFDQVGPPIPMNPGRGSRALRGIRDELDTSRPEEPAAPEEFGLGDELTLADDGFGRGELPTDFNAIETTLSEGAVKLGDGDVRSIVIKPFGDRMRIQQTDVRADMQKRGYNRQNIADALAYAQERGMPLDSDVSFTKQAWDSWKSALDSGAFEGDVDRAAVEAAMEAGGGVARNPSGEPWITNIRLGPAAKP